MIFGGHSKNPIYSRVEFVLKEWGYWSFSLNHSFDESPNNLTYKDYSEITGSTTYRLGDNWGGYRTKIFQGFRDTNKNAMFLYVLEPKPTSLMNWNSVPWDNNSK